MNYSCDGLFGEPTIPSKEGVTFFFVFTQFLPHRFYSLTKFVDLRLSFLLFLQQFVTFGSESVEDILFETNFLRSTVMIIQDESVEIGLRVEVMERT